MTLNKNMFRMVLFLIVCIVMGGYYFDSVYSLSVDVAHHYALTARIYDHGYFFPVPDPSLGEMNVYPRVSHALAAFAGHLFASPLMGMQLVSFVSIFILWGSILWMMMALPRRALAYACVSFVVILCIFRKLHFPVFGYEVFDNFFFAQLVAQGLMFLAMSICLLMERKQIPPAYRYIFLAASLLFIESIHLIPVFELFGWMLLLMLFDFVMNQQRKPIHLMWLIFFGIILIALILAHPTYKVMKELSVGNGALDLAHIPDVGSLMLWCFFISICSFGLLLAWVFRLSTASQNTLLFIKYIALFGMTVPFLCLAQMVLFKLGHGSEYACKKYIFGLDTALLLDMVLLPIVFFKEGWLLFNSKSLFSKLPESIVDLWAVPLLMTFVLFLFFRHPKLLSLDDIWSLEQVARTIHAEDRGRASGQFDYAIGLHQDRPMLDYLVSIGVFNVPRDDNSISILSGHAYFSKTSNVHAILTSMGNPEFDVLPCRQAVFNNIFVLISAKCSLRQSG